MSAKALFDLPNFFFEAYFLHNLSCAPGDVGRYDVSTTRLNDSPNFWK